MEIKSEDKFSKALKFQAEGKKRHEIYKLLGYSSLDSLTKLMRRNGYKFSDQDQQYIHTDSNTQSIHTPINTDSNTQSIHTPINTVCNTTSIMAHSEIKEQQEKVVNLMQDYDTLKKMIDWFKKFDNTDSSIGIRVELPQSENTMITIRGNEKIWKAFGDFAKKNSSFTKGELLSQALKEFIEKYDC